MRYFFGLDSGESGMVVGVLAVFYRIIRTVLVVLLLSVVLGHTGIARTDMDIPTFGPGAAPNPMAEQMEQEKHLNRLIEAREYIAKSLRTAELDLVNAWYAAGAKNVYYEVNRDINGNATPYQIAVELPDDPAARVKCYQVAKSWYDGFKIPYEPESLRDTGDPYLMVPLP